MTIPLYVPPEIGVPESAPVLGFSVSPGGSVPANTLYVGAINTNGFAGIGLVCFGGTYLFNPQFVNGVLISGSCSL
jgi:hypothetical protein